MLTMLLTSNLKSIFGMNKTTLLFVIHFPARLPMSSPHVIIHILQHVGNLCWTTGDLPIYCKSTVVKPLIKNAKSSPRNV